MRYNKYREDHEEDESHEMGRGKHRKKLERMEEELQHDKKSHHHLMGALKNHFRGDEHIEERELRKEEKEEKNYKSKHKNMDKDARKKMAVIIMKKKMA